MYTMLCGNPPYWGETEEETAKKIIEGAEIKLDGPIWFDISKEAKDIVKKLLTSDPEERINDEKALKHEWFEKAKAYTTVISKDQLILFNSKEKLTQSLVGYFGQHLVYPQLVSKLEKKMKECDSEETGVMQSEDFIKNYKEFKGCNYDDDELMVLMAQVDTEQKGQIDYSMYAKSKADRQHYLCVENLEWHFRFFDKAEQLKGSLKRLRESVEPWRKMDEGLMKRFDKKVNQLGDDGEHLFATLKDILIKLFRG